MPQIDAARRRLLLAPLALAAGCSFDPDADHVGDDAPSAEPLDRPVRMAWVFSSGGPRGFVHVGVIKALTELGLAPDLVVGASAGALVGTLYAAGQGAPRIEALAYELQPLRLARLALGVPERFSGAPLRELMRVELSQRRLEQLPVAMVCAAHRLGDDRTVGFTRGDIGLAVQASSAIEGRFAPVRIRGQRYVDADLHMPMPVRLARRLGAQRVLAVDASAHEDRAPEGAEGFRETDRRKRLLTQPDAEAADRVLHPDFGYWVSLSREFRERAIEAGYRSTMAQADALKRLHA